MMTQNFIVAMERKNFAWCTRKTFSISGLFSLVKQEVLNGGARILSIYYQTLLNLTALHYAIFKATLDTLTQPVPIDPCKCYG